MELLPPYILKISVSLTVVYLIYHFLLRRLTFYSWNRAYLLGLSMVSFCIPFIDISSLLPKEDSVGVIGYIPPLLSVINPDNSYTFFDGAITGTNAILLLVATGAMILFARLLVQYRSFRKMMRSADVIMEGPVRIYQVHDNIVPFSFANSIFINAAQHDEAELREIIRHEFIHVKQRHSIDIIVSEFLVIFNWYNPIAWLIRSAIRQNLEFIADEQVIQKGFDKRQYQYLLLKVIGTSPYAITNKFNFNSLKKRITMMNKHRSARVHLLRFALVVPVVAISLVAFRGQQYAVPALTAIITDTVPVKPLVKPEDISLININSKTIEIRLKDGTADKYNLDNSVEKAAFEKKYGKLPTPPPPPAAPDAPGPPSPPGQPVMPEDIVSMNIIKKNGVNSITIERKDGKTENFNLNNKKDRADFEARYGKLTPPPPPPPAPVPPAPPVGVNGHHMVPPVPPIPPRMQDEPFFKNNPSVRALHIDESSNLIITLKNGQREHYNLADEADKKEVIEKYGSLPAPPPPAPVPPIIGH